MIPPPDITLRLGTNDVAGVREFTVTQRLGAGASAEAGIGSERLSSARADYLADAAILDDQLVEMFLGVVESVTLAKDEAQVSLRNGVELQEALISGLGAAAISPLEMIWSLARTAGIPSEKIAIAGWAPGPVELFEVVVPVYGLELRTRWSVGHVLFTVEEHARAAVDGLGPDPLRTSFQDASCWAVTQIFAPTVLDAEALGASAIVSALGWLSLRSCLAAAALPNGQPIGFMRKNTVAMPYCGDSAYVRGLVTGRRWLRSRSDARLAQVLNPNHVDLFSIPPFPQHLLTPQELEAIAAWQRSVGGADLVARASAISEAIEFLCASESGKHALFSKRDRGALLAFAREHYNEEQQRRFADMVAMLNAPSLLVKLKLWLEAENLVLTASDFEVLDRVRRARNDFVHGRSRDVPTSSDLRYASSVVNRMLVQRVFNVADANSLQTTAP